jgi:hypothetical protein
VLSLSGSLQPETGPVSGRTFASSARTELTETELSTVTDISRGRRPRDEQSTFYSEWDATTTAGGTDIRAPGANW